MPGLRWMLLLIAAGLATSPALALDKSVKAIGARPADLKEVGITGIDGTGVKIGQLEGGNPRVTHKALVPKVLVFNGAITGDFENDHATRVAGVMVSHGGAGADKDKKGVAPGANVYSFATTSSTGAGKGADPRIHHKAQMIEGADALIDKLGVQIINFSAGQRAPEKIGADGTNQITLAVDYYAFAKNIIWTQAVANDGRFGAKSLGLPEDCYNCIAVGATGPTPNFHTVALFSSEGRTADLRNKPDIVAPGTNLSMPTTLSNGFGPPDSGASFAAPHVAGVAAQLLQFAAREPKNLDRADHRVIKAVLLNSASKDRALGDNKPGEIRVFRKDGTTRWSPKLPGIDPLDDQMGAGEVNARAAFVQFNRPEATTTLSKPGTNNNFEIGPIAWDFNQVSVGNYNQYDIKPDLEGGTKLTATLIWDRHVDRNKCTALGCVPFKHDTFTAFDLSNLDLDLYKDDVLLHAFDGDDDDPLKRASFSHSPFDSVEHIYFTLPEDGSYSVRVSNRSGQKEEYGFAVWS